MSLGADEQLDRLRIVFFGTCMLIMLPWLGSKDFSTRGEAREAMVAQAMVESGNWILPTVYNEGVPSKPPLLHWLAAASSIPRGEVTEFSARLPSAVASLVFLFTFMAFIRRRLGVYSALMSGFLLATSVEWFRASLTCRVDLLLSALMAGALLSFYRWQEEGMSHPPVLAALLVAGATLTKGPVGVVLTCGIMGLFLVVNGFSVVRAVVSVSRIAVPAVLLAGLWYLLAFDVGRERFLDKFYYENVARFSGTMEDAPHSHSAPYLWLTMVVGFLPLAVLVVSVVRWNPSATRAWLEGLWRERRSSLEAFSLLAVLVVLLFFSIPSSKRSTYLLPAYPFAAILLAQFLGYARRRSERLMRRVVMVGLIVLGSCSLAIGITAIAGPISAESLFVRDFVTLLSSRGLGLTVGLCIVALAVCVLAGRSVMRPNSTHWVHLSGAALLAVLLLVNSRVLPAGADALSPKRFSDEIRGILREGEVYSYLDEFYAISFYTGTPIRSLSQAPTDGALVLTYEDNLQRLGELLGPGRSIAVLRISGGSVVKENRRLALVRIES